MCTESKERTRYVINKNIVLMLSSAIHSSFKRIVVAALFNTDQGYAIAAAKSSKPEKLRTKKFESSYKAYTTRFDKTINILKHNHSLIPSLFGIIQVLNKSQL